MLPSTFYTRLLAAAAVGVVWAISFPLPSVAGLAWVVPGLLLATTVGADRRLAFRAAYVAGAVHYLVSLSWLRFIPFPLGAFTGWFALSFFLALFPAAWAVACWGAAKRLGLGMGLGPTERPAFQELGARWSAVSFGRLNLWFLICASTWVSWEMLLARMFGGFPWNLLGASQYRMLPLIQIASFTGVYGVSFVVVWFSVSLFAAILLLLHNPDRPGVWRRPLLFPALMLIAVMAGGFLILLTEAPPPRRIQVAVVQPSIPQLVIFDPDSSTNRFETLLQLTEQALATHPDLLLWPEASLPGGLSRTNFDRLAAKVRAAGTWMIFGADEVEPAAPNDPGAPDRAFNSAFLLGPEGKVTDSYRKRRLVMFGEYIPFGRTLKFLQRLAPIGEGLDAGDHPVTFRLSNLDVAASVLICFEDNFPQQAREHAASGIDFLINLTNDAWFGHSSAQWQHAANAVFRAIENGVPLVRATNNGLSCWIDPRGRMFSTRLAEGRDVYEAGIEVFTMQFGVKGRTLYGRWGDAFGWACVAATLLVPASAAVRRRQARSEA